jgi:hypothetical protein
VTLPRPAAPVADKGLQVPVQWRRLMLAVALTLLLILGIQAIEITPQFVLTRTLMLHQDLPVLLLTSVVLLALAAWGLPARAATWGALITRLTMRDLALAIVIAGLVAAVGTRLVALNYGVSRDEMMVVFDTAIYASGRLLAPVPAEWRAFVPALHPDFRLPVPGNVAWVSSYLPGNAIIRALLGRLFDTAVINGLIVVTGLAAHAAVARQLWPQRPDATVIAVLLCATSAQVLCMAMTTFAMSTHLALNMIWLWLFLRGSAASHMGAVAIGFVATGLHQIVFHPLFVAPFLLTLLLERRWWLGIFYVISYAAIGVFWIVYWQLLLSGHGIVAESSSAVGATYFLSRVAALLQYFSFYGLETMTQNLLRFAAWQNPLLLILLVPGMAMAWTLGGTLRALAGGIVLTIVAMFILLPNQDIGWGYRYVHGLIGSAALLGALGWVSLTERGVAAPAIAGVAMILTAFAVVILLPIHAWQMHTHIAPFARAQAAVFKTDADAVVVETVSAYYGIDLVRNDPYLRNRPLTFDIGLLDEPLTRELCARMRLKIFDGYDAARFGVMYTDPTKHPGWPQMQRVRALVQSSECASLRRSP